MRHTVIFKPSGSQGQAEQNETIFSIARRLGIGMETPCGGAEACGKCKVIIDAKFSGSLSPLTETERKLLSINELEKNYRMACLSKIQGDIEVFVPEESAMKQQVILETGREREVSLQPAVKKYFLSLDKPTLEDYRDDVSRIIDALYDAGIDRAKQLKMDYAVLRNLPKVLRSSKWQVAVTVWNDSEIIAVENAQAKGLYGISIDIGTTTLAASLCDLHTGKVLARHSLMNSQVRYGDDVLSRISYAMQDGGTQQLHKLIIKDINDLLMHLAESCGLSPDNIYEMVLVFNTAMHHLALNIDPEYLGCAPFIAAVSGPIDIKARELGIRMAKGGYVHCLPIEAGFVGADNAAVLIAEEPYKNDKVVLIIDIGTNGEINLGCRKWLLSASCATGPALEGAEIKYGMRAAPGAIERVQINRDTLEPMVEVIGDVKAAGICGSGIIDAIAEMFKAGIILKDGAFNKKLSSPRVRRDAQGKYEYVLVRAPDSGSGQDIVICQKDVRNVQLAKAALYAGAKILMEKQGITELDEVILAGAFGSFMNKENALVIGLFPDCALDKVTVVGNAAGEGAKLALLNVEKRWEAQRIARSVRFIETAAETDFQAIFYEAMYFPHATDKFIHAHLL